MSDTKNPPKPPPPDDFSKTTPNIPVPPDDVRVVRLPHQVALVTERAHQMVGGREVELALPGDHLDGHGTRRRGDPLDDPQCSGHAADQAGRFGIAAVRRHGSRMPALARRRKSAEPISI